MKRRTLRMTSAWALMGFGLLTIASSQEADDADDTEIRILRLEQSVQRLSTELEFRTEVSGPEDRLRRDINLDQRLGAIEQQLRRLESQLTSIEREVQAASRAASQAQNEARQAQQLARNASLR